ncbi:hypothetical protein ACFOWE_24345 [Planomonospora corallina]|uniref:Uncharacterized protein n=1 Tax=Planomonospora corallina TaxID=1806052 RepID=A0ABV8IBV9_9ACTN
MVPELNTTPVAAEQLAEEVTAILEHRYGVRADVHPLRSGDALISVFAGLVARSTGQSIRWTVPPAVIGDRSKPLVTIAWTAAGAAARLAGHLAVMQRKTVESIRNGTAGTITDSYLEALTNDAAPE